MNSEMNNEEVTLTVRAVAKLLDLQPGSIRRLVATGVIPAVRLGPHGRLRIRLADVEAALKPAAKKEQPDDERNPSLPDDHPGLAQPGI